MLKKQLREAFQAGLNKGSHQSYYDAPLDEDEYIDSVSDVTKLEEVSIWNSCETTVKESYGYDRVTMLEPTPRNMHRLMLKINELVEEINKLKQ
tara:strand:- start:194 stop:475 length:282 start_codon:yes stop_codon:yes gene_type:complete